MGVSLNAGVTRGDWPGSENKRRRGSSTLSRSTREISGGQVVLTADEPNEWEPMMGMSEMAGMAGMSDIIFRRSSRGVLWRPRTAHEKNAIKVDAC